MVNKSPLQMLIVMTSIHKRCLDGYSFDDACYINGVEPIVGDIWRSLCEGFNKDIEKILAVREMER